MFFRIKKKDANALCKALIDDTKELLEFIEMVTKDGEAEFWEIEKYIERIKMQKKWIIKLLKATSREFRRNEISDLDFDDLNIVVPKRFLSDLEQIPPKENKAVSNAMDLPAKEQKEPAEIIRPNPDFWKQRKKS